MADHAGADDGRMTLIEHLTELRRRIFICVLAVALGAIVMFILFPQVLELLEEPYREVTKNVERCRPDGCDLVATNPLAPFLVRMKVAAYGGLALALPVVMWQIWRFIVPGLYPNERRYAIPFIVSAVVLFVFGAFFAWLTVDRALDFLLIGSVGGEIEPFVSADEYLTLITLMLLAFGVAFEFPLLLVFLMLVGVLNSGTLRRSRRWAAVGITVFAAIITPSQDPISLLFMAVPMYLFYEAAIVIGRVLKK
jgi:sec-independent protein translocase protein TatC